MQKKLIAVAALSGFITVALGAFGAHALKESLSEYQHSIYNKAVNYQMFHTMALFVAVFLYRLFHQNLFIKAGWAFVAGIIFFCGSLYILACKDLLNISNTKIIGPVTPTGGILFLSGWLLIITGAFRINLNKQ